MCFGFYFVLIFGSVSPHPAVEKRKQEKKVSWNSKEGFRSRYGNHGAFFFFVFALLFFPFSFKNYDYIHFHGYLASWPWIGGRQVCTEKRDRDTRLLYQKYHNRTPGGHKIQYDRIE